MSPSPLPHWLLVIGSIAGLLAATVQIAIGIRRLTAKGELEVKLTKEIFLRLTDWGESLFPHAVMVARNSSVEIRNVAFELKKIKAPMKSYGLSVLWFGEKKTSDGPFAENNFFSQSAMSFIPKDTPIRAVYIAVLDSYEKAIRAKLTGFRSEVSRLQNAYRDLQERGLPTEETRSLINDVRAVIDNATNALFDKVQIEEGEFELSICVKYRRKALIGKSEASVQSSIRFEVEPLARELLKAGLKTTLETTALNQLLNQSTSWSYPQYDPLDVKEIS